MPIPAILTIRRYVNGNVAGITCYVLDALGVMRPVRSDR